MEPTIYLTNVASLRSGPPYRGAGRVYNIMARPRPFEVQGGNVPALTPSSSFMDAARLGRMTIPDYLAHFAELLGERLVNGYLAPGELKAVGGVVVGAGDTLVCACSRDKARDGKCHRCTAARYLRLAGWRVVLDGVEVGAER